MSEKKEKLSRGAELEKKLSFKKTCYFEECDEQKKEKVFAYAEEYKTYLDESKTEREAVVTSIALAEKKGYTPYRLGDPIKPGDRKYFDNRGKSLVLFKAGKADLEKDGVRILASHIDSPRLDIKQNPLYEDSGMAFLKTHYYGGIKKYQWTAIPLALHGTVVLADGSVKTVKIGDGENDPVFYVNDLLPHLAREQAQKTMGQIIDGETLNVLVGGYPFRDDDVKEKIRLTVLSKLNELYGMTEEDFLSAELCAVPAFRARDVGFDRALVGGYGHDDKVCSYPALTALLDDGSDEHTVMVVLADKEEIGSEGNTGMQCALYEDVINALAASQGKDPAAVRNASVCLSADVTAGYDPNFASVYEKRNASLVGYGTAVCKFTGSGGKSGSNDASAELMGRIRKIFADNKVVWQTAELGRVDAGGGGTVAKYVSKMNVDTVDIGVPVISMHSPYEVISKADLYSTYEAFVAFLK